MLSGEWGVVSGGGQNEVFGVLCYFELCVCVG